MTLVLIILMSFCAQAADFAKVLVVKGEVTALKPLQHKAVLLKRGEILAQETSIVTKDKSFVRIRFSDKSIMNIGPNSMIVLAKVSKSKANMVNLLSGMLNADVKKKSNKKTKNKLIVKTRSAVMGVRGTKFQSTFNHANKRTSLLTVEGNVALAQSSGESGLGAEKELASSRDIVDVKAGRFSGVSSLSSEKVSAPTTPVKISPKQFDIIAGTMESKQKAIKVMAPQKDDPRPEGGVSKTGKVIPKAGGYIDFSTGLYVEPTKNAKIDLKTKTYTDDSIGKVSSKSGDYIPPKGIKIDAKKGFVLDVKTSEELASNDKNLSKQLDSLNGNLSDQIVVNKMEGKSKSTWLQRLLPKNHRLNFIYAPYSDELSFKNKDTDKDISIFSDSASRMRFSWIQDWTDRFFTQVSLGKSTYSVESEDSIANDRKLDDGEYFSLGIGYKFTEKFQGTMDMVDRTFFIVYPRDNFGSLDARLESSKVEMLDLGLSYKVYQSEKMGATIGGILHIIDSKNSFNGDFDNQSGATLNTVLDYKLSESTLLSSDFFFDRYVGESGELEFTRNSLGVAFNLAWDI